MRVFLPSMIEVPFSQYYKKCTKLLFESNFKSFHIDFGDGIFIDRKIDAWNKVNFLMKTYMIIAVFALMAITSLGVFGFLTAAFQKSSLETELSLNKISTLESQKKEEINKIESTKKIYRKTLCVKK